MKKLKAIIALLIGLINFSFAQSRQDIDSLLSSIYYINSSKDISKSIQAKQLINYGDNVLPTLALHFTDITKTKVKSDCQNTYLTKGEVAIVLADRIEMMPYALLTGIQNCLMGFCKDNPNYVEYYLYTIRRDGARPFQQKYVDWLNSKDRKEWTPYANNRMNKKKTR